MDERIAAGLELASRLQSRAVKDLGEGLAAQVRALETLRAEVSTSRQVQEAVLAELRSAQRASVWAWADRNPWAAVVLVLLVFLGISGQLYLLPSIAPILGGVHAK